MDKKKLRDLGNEVVSLRRVLHRNICTGNSSLPLILKDLLELVNHIRLATYKDEDKVESENIGVVSSGCDDREILQTVAFRGDYKMLERVLSYIDFLEGQKQLKKESV